jgi:hypothetical protein
MVKRFSYVNPASSASKGVTLGEQKGDVHAGAQHVEWALPRWIIGRQ